MNKKSDILLSVFFLSLPIIFAGCSGENKSNETLLLQSSVNTTKPNSQKISDKAIGDIIESIPSPLEISVMIKETGRDYDRTILNPSDNSDNYTTNYQKALNLGVYGTDLGYINLYNKSSDAISYLSSIKGLADELNIGQFYDFETIKRLSTNSSNVDSLLAITTSSFERINDFLHSQRRSEQSVLILTGGWIEALNISCSVAAKNKDEKLYEKIGEQKIVLDQLILLLGNYDSDPNIQTLSQQLISLQKIFNEIKITYTYQESEMKEVDGVLMVVDKSESKVNITKEQVAAISKLTSEIRNKIIG